MKDFVASQAITPSLAEVFPLFEIGDTETYFGKACMMQGYAIALFID
jgi:hypothetical protein